MQKKDAKELLRKYNSGTCTDEEMALLENWYLQWEEGELDLDNEERKIAKERIWRRISKSHKKAWLFRLNIQYMIAASLIFAIISVAVVFYLKAVSHTQIPVQQVARTFKNDVEPGGNKAILTLADGTVVSLDEANKGEITEVAGMRISKTTDGQIVYEVNDANKTSSEITTVPKYNRISTPRGGQYQVILPDGTKVWLNAASSLKYPVQFASKSRQVELTGEAYFEVSSQLSTSGKRIPFFVKTVSQTIEVLGTHFNINSYDDEDAVKTTLLEGAVRVFVNHQSEGKAIERDELEQNKGILLKPNQQSILKGNDLNIIKVNTEESVAWKNGYFSFKQADLPTVMRQLSRWYDVSVVYEGEIPAGTYTGKVYRNMNISKVLEILTYTQVNFRIEGKKMIIFP